MTVKELKEMLNKCNDCANVFVGCEGYTNTEEGETKIIKNNNGDIVIVDDCYYQGKYI